MTTITTERLGNGVERIALARPEARNALNRGMLDELGAALESARADPAVRAVTFTAKGPHFSAGGDIRFFQTLDRPGFLALHRDGLQVAKALAAFPKPTVAAVRGACAGGSVGLALSCDYLLASGTAYFSIQFMRIGLTPDFGTVFFLRQRVGESRARRIVLDDRLLPAEEATAVGMCDRTVADERLDEEATALAERLAALPPLAFRQTKALLQGGSRDLERFFDDEMNAAAPCLLSEEFREGTAAFLERRPPRF